MLAGVDAHRLKMEMRCIGRCVSAGSNVADHVACGNFEPCRQCVRVVVEVGVVVNVFLLVVQQVGSDAAERVLGHACDFAGDGCNDWGSAWCEDVRRAMGSSAISRFVKRVGEVFWLNSVNWHHELVVEKVGLVFVGNRFGDELTGSCVRRRWLCRLSGDASGDQERCEGESRAFHGFKIWSSRFDVSFHSSQPPGARIGRMQLIRDGEAGVRFGMLPTFFGELQECG